MNLRRLFAGPIRSRTALSRLIVPALALLLAAGRFAPPAQAQATLTLGNRIFHDFNDNGLFEPGLGEFGVTAVKLNLYLDDGDGVLDAGDGAPLASTNSVGGGLYSFAGLAAGDYIVQVDAVNFLAGGSLLGLKTSRGNEIAAVAPDPDNDVDNDDNGYNVAGFSVASQAITLALGTEPANDGDVDLDTNLSLDFGFYTPLCLGNVVWNDLDNDGLYETGSGESGIDGVLLDLYRDTDSSNTFTAGDALLSGTTTAGGGLYSFCDLGGGSYIVVVRASNFGAGGALLGYVSSLFNGIAPDSDDDTDNDDNGAPVAGGAVATKAVTLTAGGEPDKPDDGDGIDGNLTVDLGFFAPDPAVTLDKTVSLTGACPGSQTVQVSAGTQVTYCYKVTNSGDTHLIDIDVTDDQLGPICSIPGPLAPGAMQTCSQTATINVDTTNVGTASGTPSDSGGVQLPGLPPVEDTDDAVVDVVAPAIDVQKTVYLGHSAGAGCPGGELVSGLTGTNITYCFKVTNSGDTSLINLTLADVTLGINQTNMTLLSGVSPLAPGAMAVYYYESSISGDLTNTVTAGGTPSDPAGNPLPGVQPPSDTDTAAVDGIGPGILLEKTVSLTGVCPGADTVQVAAGTLVTYCYKVTNSGDTSLINITVTDDQLGPICTIPGPLAPGGMQTCSQAATINVDTVNVGTATGTPSDPAGNPLPGVPPVTDDDPATVDVVAPAVTLDKTVSLTGVCPGGQTVQVLAGTQVTYCYKVTNSGDTDLSNILVTDNLLGAICTIPGPLAPAAMQTCSQTATINVDTTNIGTATGTPTDPAGNPIPGVNPPTDTDDGVVDVVAPAIDVQKTVYLGHSAGAGCPGGELVSGLTGTAITYCFKVTNSGDTALTNLTLVDATLGINQTNMTLLSGATPLAPGAMAVYYYEGTISGDLTNTVTAGGTPSDPAGNPLPGVQPPSDTDTAQVDAVAPALTLDKTVSLNGMCPGSQTVQVDAGTQVTYCYKVTNSGDTDLSNILVTDNLLGAICTITGPLAPAAMQTCSQTATINVDTTNIGTATGTPTDPAGNPIPGVNPPTDTDDGVVDVVRPAIDVQKTVYLGHSAGEGCPGGELVSGLTGTNVTYCFKVTNSGDTALTNLTLVDVTLGFNQTNMTLLSGATPLAPGAMAVYYYEGTISGDLTNTVTAGGTPSDPAGNPLPGVQPPSDTDTAAVDGIGPGILLEKTVSLTGVCQGADMVQVVAGTLVTYCYKVTNSGDTNLINIIVTDNLLGPICTIPGPLAPGAMQTCSQTATINADTVNVGTATGSASDPAGNPLPGVPPVTDDDPATVDVVAPAVTLDKTVSTNGSCPGSQTVQVLAGTQVTYCYKVTNSGDTDLTNILVTDNLLGAICTITGPLAPTAMQTCSQLATINVDTTNIGTATGTPTDPAGNPIPGVNPPTDSDDAVVDVVPPATVCVGDTVFFDLDNDGLFEPGSGEFGISGVAVTVLADTDSSGDLTGGDTSVGSVITGVDGSFQICALPAGDYIVRLDQSNFNPGGVLENLISSSGNDILGQAPDPDTDLDDDDNGNPVLGQGVATKAVTLTAGGEPGVGVDGDGSDSNGTVDLGLIQPQSPTGVRLLSLRADSHADGSVEISWRVAQEADVLGYHLYRSPSPTGTWERVTERLMPTSDGFGDHAYFMADQPAAGQTMYYRLEVVGADGRTERYGPLLAQPRVLRAIYLPFVSAAR